MKLVIGLGNPGKEYERTRHNIGYRVVDKLAAQQGWKWNERRGQFQVYSLNTTVFQDLLTEILGWLGGLEPLSPPFDGRDGADAPE